MSSPKARAHHRVQCQFPVTMAHEGRQYTGTTVNLGVGGMYVEGPELPPFSASIEVRMQLPGMDTETTIAGTVRWVRPGGVGVQFGSLRARDVWAINKLPAQSA